jgi:hypothetical protein
VKTRVHATSGVKWGIFRGSLQATMAKYSFIAMQVANNLGLSTFSDLGVFGNLVAVK